MSYQGGQPSSVIELVETDIYSESVAVVARDLLEQLGGLTVSNTVIKPTARNRFVERYSWVPFSQREATIALQGVNVAINRSGHARVNKDKPIETRLKPVEKTLREIEGFYSSSLGRIAVLNHAAISGEGETEKIVSDWDLIHENAAIIYDGLTQFVLAYRELDFYYWPPVNAKLRKSAEEQIHAQLETLAPKEIKRVWTIARENEKKRLRFWLNGSTEARKNPLVEQFFDLKHQPIDK